MKRSLLILILLLTLVFIFVAACSKTEKPGIRYEIDFGGVEDISDVRMEYDANALAKRVSGEKAYVYTAQKVDDYDGIAEKFGFTASQKCPSVDKTVEYQDGSEDPGRRLFIWPNGKTVYETGMQETSFETKVSKDDCIELSKQVLKQYGSTSHSFDTECFCSETLLTDPAENKTKTIGYTVVFYFLIDGTRLYGEPRVIIKFNGNGEVVSITYNMPDYAAEDEAEIANVRRTLQSIQRGEVPVLHGLEDIPDRITIEDLKLCYYSQTFDQDVAVAQPIYVFSAVGHYENEDVAFDLLVQAN